MPELAITKFIKARPESTTFEVNRSIAHWEIVGNQLSLHFENSRIPNDQNYILNRNGPNFYKNENPRTTEESPILLVTVFQEGGFDKISGYMFYQEPGNNQGVGWG